jgi:hypothetical protein
MKRLYERQNSRQAPFMKIMKNISPLFCLFLIFFHFVAYSQKDESKGDWANLKKYAEANKKLPPQASGEERIVFMGNSITEF